MGYKEMNKCKFCNKPVKWYHRKDKNIVVDDNGKLVWRYDHYRCWKKDSDEFWKAAYIVCKTMKKALRENKHDNL